MKKIIFALILTLILLLIPVSAEETENQIFYWNFNGHGRDASYQKLDIIDSENLEYTDGKLGKALDLTEGTGMVKTDFTDCVFENFTMAAWVYLDENVPEGTGFQIVMAKDNKAAGHFELFVHLVEDHYQLEVYAFDLGGAVPVNQSIPMGEWIHIAATYDGQYQKLYINGVEAASVENELKPLDTSTEESIIAIGSLVDDTFPFFGKIDEAVLANYAFDAARIASLHNKPEEAAAALLSEIGEAYPEGETPRPDVTPTPGPTQEPTPTPEATAKSATPVPTQKQTATEEASDNGFLVPVIVVATLAVAAVVVFLIIKPGKKKK